MGCETNRLTRLLFLLVVTLAAGPICLAQAPGAEESPDLDGVSQDALPVKTDYLKMRTPLGRSTRFIPSLEERNEAHLDTKRDLKVDREDRDSDDSAGKPEKEKFYWRPAMRQSLFFLGIQHGARMFQEKTTRQFKGPFFRDWGRSIKNLRGWRDGDNTFINYVAHPIQGALTGRIFVNNSDNAKRQEFGRSRGYWKSRAKALVWSSAWSTQFELGPFSEASIGNVGFPRKDGSRSTGYVDYVVTPAIGTGVLVGEDAIDKYVLKGWIERNTRGRLSPRVKLFRSLLTPTTSFANLLRGKYPWKRDNR